MENTLLLFIIKFLKYFFLILPIGSTYLNNLLFPASYGRSQMFSKTSLHIHMYTVLIHLLQPNSMCLYLLVCNVIGVVVIAGLHINFVLKYIILIVAQQLSAALHSFCFILIVIRISKLTRVQKSIKHYTPAKLNIHFCALVAEIFER